jgi:hypothetical protein
MYIYIYISKNYLQTRVHTLIVIHAYVYTGELREVDSLTLAVDAVFDKKVTYTLTPYLLPP